MLKVTTDCAFTMALHSQLLLMIISISILSVKLFGLKIVFIIDRNAFKISGQKMIGKCLSGICQAIVFSSNFQP